MNTESTVITTARLTLGPIRKEDFDALISIFKSDKVSATYMVPNLTSKADEERIFSFLATLSTNPDRCVYGIFCQDRLVGIINDTDIDGNTIELGYAMHPDYFGNGYMTEALKAIIHHLFTKGFLEITAGAFENNYASIRVMQKCEMLPIDKREEILYRGVTHPCVFFSIRKESRI